MNGEAIPSRIIDLNRRVSRALETGRGIKLTADDLDALAMIDAFTTVQNAANEALKEQARCRAQRKSFIDGGNTGLHGIGSGTEASAAHTRQSSGMTPNESGREALARAQATLSKRS